MMARHIYHGQVENAAGHDVIINNMWADPTEDMTVDHCGVLIARLSEERRIFVTVSYAEIGLLVLAAFVGYPRMAVLIFCLAGMIAIGAWGDLKKCRIDSQIWLYKLRQRKLLEAEKHERART